MQFDSEQIEAHDLQVQREISTRLARVTHRAQYRRDAQLVYQQKMLAAHAGKIDYPRVRTFKQSDSSTNNVFHDLKEAERWTGMEGKLDIGELTWEQRERVLRLLFAKMNGFKDKKRCVLSGTAHVDILCYWSVLFLCLKYYGYYYYYY